MIERRFFLRTLSLTGAVAGMIAVATVGVQERSVSAAVPAAMRAPAQGRGAAPLPTPTSPEVQADRRVTFRIYAPDAQKVELRSPGDIPGVGGRGVAPPQLTKTADGVWERTVGPVPAGAYRYVFGVDGVTVVDSRNPMTSQTNTTVYSLAVVPGSDVFDTKNVPHGAVASVHYNSTALGGIRRMHVYTPPGYETGRDRYPVFYLLHGAGDVDDVVDLGRPRRLHPRQPDRGEQGQADDRRDARRPRQRRRRGARRRDPAAAAQDMPGIGCGPDPFVNDFIDRSDAVRREELPRADRSSEPRHRRALDGRQPDAEHRDPASREVRVHRRLQLGNHQRRPRQRRRRPDTGAAVRRSVGEAEPGRARQRGQQARPEPAVVRAPAKTTS